MVGVVVLTQGESVMTWCASSAVHSGTGLVHGLESWSGLGALVVRGERDRTEG